MHDLPEAAKRKILETFRRTGNVVRTARECECSNASAQKYGRDVVRAEGGKPATIAPQVAPQATHFNMPEPAAEAGGLGIPEATYKPLVKLQVDNPGWHLVLGDVHLPMHDKGTIEAAVKEAKDKKVSVVLLNGDIMDMFGITPFFRPPSDDRFVDEVECGKQFLTWMRSQLPHARFVYREGNHEFRLKRFIAEKAPELYDLPCLSLGSLLEFDKHGIEWIDEKRKVLLGKLITLHGHEFRKGEGINPARLAFLRATASVLVGHHHRTSEHHQRALDERHHAVWSVGCACYIHPDYDPYNQWNHGYAMVDVASDGWFSVHNRRVLNGRVL